MPGTDPVSDDSAAGDWSALMAAAQAGDRAAYRALLLAIVPYVRALAARAFRERADVEDAVQDVLTTLHATRRMYDPARPFRPWLAGIARHRIADRRRQLRRRDRLEVQIEPVHETFADPAAKSGESASDADTLRAAVASLPAGQRAAIELMKLQEMSLQDAAATSGMSVAALKVATHRAVKRLRRAFGVPEGGEPA